MRIDLQTHVQIHIPSDVAAQLGCIEIVRYNKVNHFVLSMGTSMSAFFAVVTADSFVFVSSMVCFGG